MASWLLEGLIAGLVFYVFMFCWKITDNYRLFTHNENIFKKVGWISFKEPPGFYSKRADLRDEDLIYYIMVEQYNLDILNNYPLEITTQEEHLVEDILEVYRKNVIRSYFLDILSNNKELTKLSSIEYFMFSLCTFLQTYTVTKCAESKYVFNKKIYSVDYKLTDFGKVYYKVYLITRLFCEKNEKTKNFLGGITSNQIIEYIKSC